jgi:hypothetical protein
MTPMTTQNSSTSNNFQTTEFQNPFILTYYILLSIYETQSFKLLINLLRILLLHVLNKSIFQLPIGLITIYYTSMSVRGRENFVQTSTVCVVTSRQGSFIDRKNLRCCRRINKLLTTVNIYSEYRLNLSCWDIA